MLCETIAVDPSSLFYFAHGSHGSHGFSYTRFFEHESHELNEYFIAHGSHGSHGFLTRDFLNTNRMNYTNILLHTDLTDHTDLVRGVALTGF